MPFLNDYTKNKKAKNSYRNKYTRVERKELKMSDYQIGCRPTVKSPKEMARCIRKDTTFSRIGAVRLFVPHKMFLY